tara:strand:- start:70 stop:474 length:405 start_codon:yes stop_codon:yes gene_type:complete
MSKNDHNKRTGSNIERSDERIDQRGEVFTPLECCYEMIDEIPLHILKNPDSTFLDNSAGSGNFLVALVNRLNRYHTERHIVENMLYGVELMEDNHKEMCDRLGISTDHPHYICHDALTYDYSFGNPVGLDAFFT